MPVTRMPRRQNECGIVASEQTHDAGRTSQQLGLGPISAPNGCTGANLDRPALQKLLADLQAGRLDCVVVYKIDRLENKGDATK